MSATTDAPIVELDSRRRLSLSKVGHPEYTRYFLHEEPDGTIVLTPAVVMTAFEAKVIAHPELARRFEEASVDDDWEELDLEALD
jgi:hypothetical protein